MGEKHHTCVLGKFWRVNFTPENGNTLARMRFNSDFDPSHICIELMSKTAEGIEGIADVIPQENDATFALVFDRGVEPTVLASMWITACRKALQKVKREERAGLIATGHTGGIDIRSAMAISSEEITGLYATQ